MTNNNINNGNFYNFNDGEEYTYEFTSDNRGNMKLEKKRMWGRHKYNWENCTIKIIAVKKVKGGN
jgi:hypothetical protein